MLRYLVKFPFPIRAEGVPVLFAEAYTVDQHLVFVIGVARHLQSLGAYGARFASLLVHAVIAVRDYQGRRKLRWARVEVHDDSVVQHGAYDYVDLVEESDGESDSE